MSRVQTFDGHNDAVLRLWKGGREGVADRFRASETGHIDVKRAKAGGFTGGFFAMFVPGTEPFDPTVFGSPPYDVPLPSEIEPARALRVVKEQAQVLHDLDAAGDLALCRTAADIDDALAAGRIAAVMHLEGAEAIDSDLEVLDGLYDLGLRSLGPVWSRPTIFGHGVPFRFPSDGDTGPGLTEAGKRLVQACHDKKIVVDMSHLTLKGFYDTAEFGAPVVATHSNAHSISPSARNLTDDQLRTIGQSGGMVGLNYGTVFLDPSGGDDPDRAAEAIMRHLDHMLEHAGEDAVGLGSDFDGAPMPRGLTSCGDLPAFADRMRAHGYDEVLLAKIMGQNWLNFLRRYWG